jgi:spore maturation protein A
LVIGFTFAFFTGRIEAATQALVDSAKTAVDLSIGLLGVICLWTGLMSIAEKSGLVRRISRAFMPILRLVFPGVPEKHPAMGAIVMNLSANFLGLGNAATPLGIKAMNELQKLNPDKNTSTDAMSMFLVMNTSAVQLVPATIIALRSAAGSMSPAEIILPIWVTSILATLTGISVAKFFAAGSGKIRGVKWKR